MFPRAVASSATFARLFIKFILSVFTLFFTALFATMYYSWAAAFVDRVLLLFITAFFSFITCNLLIVPQRSNPYVVSFSSPKLLHKCWSMSSLDIPNVGLLPCFLHQEDPIMSHICSSV